MFVGCRAHNFFCGLRIIQSFVRSWVHKVYGALGSKSLWGVGLIKFVGSWAHKIYRYL